MALRVFVDGLLLLERFNRAGTRSAHALDCLGWSNALAHKIRGEQRASPSKPRATVDRHPLSLRQRRAYRGHALVQLFLGRWIRIWDWQVQRFGAHLRQQIDWIRPFVQIDQQRDLSGDQVLQRLLPDQRIHACAQLVGDQPVKYVRQLHRALAYTPIAHRTRLH